MKKQLLSPGLFNYRRLLTVIFLLFSFSTVRAQTPLVAGDIAVLGINCDDALPNQRWAFIPLVNLSQGTVIHFTDAGFIASTNQFLESPSNEGHMTWTVDRNISAGTVFVVTNVLGGAGNASIKNLNSVSHSGVVGTLGGDFSAFGPTGDQVLVYQGTAGTTENARFIYALNNGQSSLNYTIVGGWQTTTNVGNHLSSLPPGLTNGVSALALTINGSNGVGNYGYDNMRYNGIISGTKAALLAAIGNPANWLGHDTAPYDFSNTLTNFTVTGVVAPTPVATANPVSQPICSGNTTNVALTSNPAGATFSWTVATTSGTVSGATAGSGTSIVQALSGNGTVNYTVTPTLNGVAGNPIIVPVTVNLLPVAIATPSSAIIASGSSTNIALTSIPFGATFSWTASVISGTVNGVSAGSGTTIAQQLTGNGVVNYSITPILNGCPGSSHTIALTVQPALTAPIVLSVSSTKANNSYKVGSVIPIAVTFDQAVDVVSGGGLPTLLLETGATDRAADFVSGSGTSVLIFNYTVQAGDVSADLDYASSLALILNGGTIKSTTSGNANLTLPTPGTANSLGANKNIIIDTEVPNAPTALSMAAGSDSGASFSDGITNDTTPMINGRAEANTAVTLYDTDGATVLGTDVADGSGNWSIVTIGLAQGTHNLKAKAKDVAGNTSLESTELTVLIDTFGPTSMALSRTSVSSTDAISGATVATLSATDATSISYGFAVGNGTIDADNVSFVISGNALKVGGSSLSAGTYRIYIHAIDLAGNDSYQIFAITVNNVSHTLTFTKPGPQVYGSSFVLTATSSYLLPVTFTSDNLAVATVSGNTVTIIGVGVVNITASQPGNGSAIGAATPVSWPLQITPLPVTVAAAASSKVFDSPEPLSFGFSISPALIGNDTKTGALARQAGENAGTYAIGIGTFALDPLKYTLTYVPANFSISKKTVTINPIVNTKVYSENDPWLSFIIDVPGVPVTGRLTRTAGEDVGSYAYSISGMTVGSNYQLALNATPKFIITPLTINVTATAGNKQYGDMEPVLAYTHFPALKSGDSFNGSLARIPGETPGIYPVSRGTLALSANYQLIYDASLVNFTVLKKDINIVPAAGQGKVYGDLDRNIDYVANPALINGDTFSGALSRTAGTAVNHYPIGMGSLIASNPQNYNLILGTENYAITKKTITVTATPVSKVYGDADPVIFPYTQSTPLVVGDTFTGALSRALGENVGAYAIGKGDLALSSNYMLDYTPANLSIGLKTINVVAKAKAKVYGDADPVFEYDFSPALKSGDTFTGTLSRALGENIGAYAIGKGDLALNANYTLDYTPANLSIGLKTINVVAKAKAKVYGDADPALEYDFSPALKSGDTFTGALLRALGENVGAYSIGKGDLALNANYTLDYTPANLSIGLKTINVVAKAKAKVYGDADPVFEYDFSPALKSGDTFTGALSRALGENVGAYAIGKGDLALNANYTLNYTPVNLTINAALLRIKAVDKEKFAGTANPTFTAEYIGFVNEENTSVLTTPLGFSTTADINSPIGDYDIIPSGAVANNYQISYTKGVLKIKPGAPTSITLAAVTVYENRPVNTNAGMFSSTSDDPSATFTYTLVAGSGDTDNVLFSIVGNKINTAASLNFENKPVYKVRVRSTTQYNLWAEREMNISISDVNEIPTLATINNQTICYTTSAQSVALTGITAGPDANQTTSLKVSSSNPNLFNSLTVNGTGNTGTISYRVRSGAVGTATITVTVKDDGGIANGGVDTYGRNFEIRVNALPVVLVSSNKGAKISKGETVELTAKGGVNYEWADDSSIIQGKTTAVLTVRPRETTTYTVTATNASGCKDTQTFTVTVLDDLMTIKATNILTPNGDEVNDKWIIDNIDFYPNNEVKIFDKAGRLLYAKKGYDNSWDGMLNGTALTEGTYYYIIDFGTERLKFKGFITILRPE